MPARVVDDLEAIQVEITQHVLALTPLTALGRFFEAPFKLASVDQSGQCIVGRLI